MVTTVMCSCGKGCPYRLISLTRGMVAKVSPEDYDSFAGFRWCVDNQGYARRRVYKRVVVRMHRIVTDAQPGQIVDHINRDKLDNRRCNLRFATRAMNVRNCKIHSHNKSGVHGVHWSKQIKRWVVQIRVDGKTRHVGTFTQLEDAASARRRAEATYWGDER